MSAVQISRILKFLTVGLLNTAIGLSVIYAAMFFGGTSPFRSNAIGYSAGLLFGYFLNKRWTFKYHGQNKSSLAMYLCVIAFSYGVNIALVHLEIDYFGINPYGAQLPGMISYTAISYIGCKKLVFNRPFSEI